MPDKVLVYSRFPKAQLIRFGERYELLNAAGKRPDEAFPAAELADIRADRQRLIVSLQALHDEVERLRA